MSRNLSTDQEYRQSLAKLYEIRQQTVAQWPNGRIVPQAVGQLAKQQVSEITDFQIRLAGMNNNLYITKYQLELPKKEAIQKFLENELRETK
jgi:hypothetical protein